MQKFVSWMQIVVLIDANQGFVASEALFQPNVMENESLVTR
jgi:hypothetical protein